jgi:hypothetical protein
VCHRFILESMIINHKVLAQCLDAIFLEYPSALFLAFAAAACQAWCFPTNQTLLILHMILCTHDCFLVIFTCIPRYNGDDLEAFSLSVQSVTTHSGSN